MSYGTLEAGGRVEKRQGRRPAWALSIAAIGAAGAMCAVCLVASAAAWGAGGGGAAAVFVGAGAGAGRVSLIENKVLEAQIKSVFETLTHGNETVSEAAEGEAGPSAGNSTVGAADDSEAGAGSGSGEGYGDEAAAAEIPEGEVAPLTISSERR